MKRKTISGTITKTEGAEPRAYLKIALPSGKDVTVLCTPKPDGSLPKWVWEHAADRVNEMLAKENTKGVKK